MPNITDYRNAVYSADGINQVDLEILTDEYGWIKTTIFIDDDDEQPHIIRIKQWLKDNVDLIEPYIQSQPLSENEIADLSRLAEYPSVGDQLDMIFHDLEDGTKLWQDHIRAIKTKYPKV